ncbi:hypothetical protein KCP75_10450 [Salmonella enterica subsp. enterica]|nr:hypothetical protein KCP75_10450 [Salmonella enterica subsp. enterica]
MRWVSEEEGIPFPASASPAGDVADSARRRRAVFLPLLVGIRSRSTPPSRALQEFTRIGAPLTLMHHQDSQAHRNTGNNAARLVKGSLSGISMFNHRRTAV